MDQRLSLVTLGVADLARSRRFYAALGWQASGAGNADVAFFQAGGMVLALWGQQALAEDAGVANEIGPFRGVSLAQNVASTAEVDRVMAEAELAGARIVKPAQEAFWGGYTGYFADPDGHLWEIAWNPQWTLGPDGEVRLPS
jgi:catechol 2,3-dioxygenase-like lactoylglutathione lyase family enzyme